MSGFLLDWAERGQIDLAIAYEVPASTRLHIETLGREDLLLVASPAMVQDLPPAIDIADLRNRALILPGFPHSLRHLVDRVASEASVQIDIGAEVDSTYSIKKLVAGGLERLTKRVLARWRGMARPLLPDDLWTEIAPLLAPRKPRPKGGRPPIDDRAALTGILFVLRSGLPWEMLPAEMGCGSGMSCWRRLRDWQDAGVWAALHRALLERLHAAGQIDLHRVSLDGASVPAKRGAPRPGRTQPTGVSPAASATSPSTRAAHRWAC